MFKSKLITVFCMVVIIGSVSCKKGMEDASDPLKKQAEEHYTKARQLFLTCDPDNYPKAAEEYQLALKYWDEYPEALAGLAETISMLRGYNINEEEFGKAYQLAQRSLRLNPKLGAGYRAMADLFRHKKENDRALRQIELAIKYEPNSAENLYVKGSSLMESDPVKAYKILKDAVVKNPDLPKTYFNLASAAQKLGLYDESIATLQKYLTMAPSDVSAYTSLGMVYLNKMQKDPQKDPAYRTKSIEQFKIALAKADPQKKPWQFSWTVLSLKTLAQLSIEDKKYPEALEYLKKAEAFFDKDPEVYFLYGMVYKDSGNKALAKENLEKALTLAPDAKEIQQALKEL
jgi:tetratricopeptide (TPR) repeat protein